MATVLLLRYYSKKIGKQNIGSWLGTTILFFESISIIFIDLFASFRLSDPILFGIIFTMVFTMTKPIGGILFGVAFWIISRRVSQHGIKDYLIVSAYGIVLLFTSNQATDLIGCPISAIWTCHGLIYRTIIIHVTNWHLFLSHVYIPRFRIA